MSLKKPVGSLGPAGFYVWLARLVTTGPIGDGAANRVMV
jgi:hypothetical protein